MTLDFRPDSDDSLDFQLDFRLDDEQPDIQGKQPSQLERSLSQLAVDIPAAVRATPRFLLEAPGFFADVGDILAERIQQPIRPTSIPGSTEGLSLIQRLLPDLFPEQERRPDEDIFKPGEFIRGLIPEGIQEAFQSFKEAKEGDVPFFPTGEEAREEVIGQLTNPDSFLRETLPGLVGEEPLNFEKTALEIEDLLTPKSIFEKTQQRAIQFGIPGAILGGAQVGPAAAGTGLGIADALAEERGVSEDDRKIAAILLGPLFSKAGKSAVDAVSAIKSSLRTPPGVPSINTPTDLAVRLLSPRMKNVNIETIKIAQKEGINPTLATITEGGMLQFGANTLSQNFLTKRIFDQSVKQMGQDIQSALERKIDTISAKDFLDLSKVSEEQIGKVPFNNPTKILVDSFSDDALSVFETGDQVQVRLNEISDSLRAQSSKIFNAVKSDGDLGGIFDTRRAFRTVGDIKFQKGKVGVRSPEVSSLLDILNSLESFLNPKKSSVTIRDAISQIEELNRIIDFNESIGNQSKILIPIRRSLIESVDSQLRSFGRSDLADAWQQAKDGYSKYAETFGRDNRPVFDALNTQKPESIVSNSQTRSGMEAFLRAFSRSNKKENSYFNLQKKSISELIGEDALAAEEFGQFKLKREKVKRLEELTPILQMDAQTLIGDIRDLTERVETGKLKPQLAMDAIRADILNSLARGELPAKTLRIMNTMEGIKLVSDTLNTTPQGVNFLKALQKQKAIELMFDKAVRPDGSVNIGKINQNINEAVNIQKLKIFLGENAFKQLQEIGKFTDRAIAGDTAFKNFSQTETVRQNTALVKKLFSIGKLFAVGSIGLAVAASIKSLGAFGSIYGFAKLYTNPRFLNAMNRVSRIAAEAKKTPKNAKIYNDSVISLLDVIREELPASGSQEESLAGTEEEPL